MIYDSGDHHSKSGLTEEAEGHRTDFQKIGNFEFVLEEKFDIAGV